MNSKKITLRVLLSFFLLLFACFVNAANKSIKSALHSNGIEFTENKGQIVDQERKAVSGILYMGDAGNGTKIYFQKNKISYVQSRIDGYDPVKEQQEKWEHASTKIHRVDMEFENANPNTVVVAEEKTKDHINYYLPQCKDGLTANSYLKLTYKEIYPNIDIVFKACLSDKQGGKFGGLEYDFVLRPGANPNDIKIKYKGAENIKLDDQTLIIQTSIGEIKEYIPGSYQIINDKKVAVKAEYSLSPSTGGRAGEGLLTFKLETFNSSFPLIIDPWATYYGGTDFDQGSSIATDNSGNVVITGSAGSNDFPVSVGAFQSANSGVGGGFFFGSDAFVVKFGPAGNRLWATYYGGSGSSGDIGYSIATDNSDNIVFTGYTSSFDFPVSAGAFQSANAGSPFSGSNDAFVVKFSPAGNRLWATYYGGISDETGYGIAADNNDNVFVSGASNSTNLPLMGFSFQGGIAGAGGFFGGNDAFVLKLNSSGIPQWATYYGGTSDESGQGISTDANNNVAMVGYTESNNLPVSFGAAQPIFKGVNDVFVVKFDPNGARLWATYCGGSLAESTYWGSQACGLDIDASNNIVITGSTMSTNFFVTPGAYQTVIGDNIGGFFNSGDVFIVKYSSSGTILWATYFGGEQSDEGFGVAIGANNTIYIGGDTYSLTKFPVTPCAFQTAHGGGGEDNFLASFDSLGVLICSGYVGGNGHDEMDSQGHIAVYGPNVYIVGFTPSPYPVTQGAFQTNFGGSYDAYIAQLCANTCGYGSVTPNLSALQPNICTGTTASFNTTSTGCSLGGGPIFQWTFPGGNPSSSTSATPSVLYNSTGSYDVKLVVTTLCGTDSVTETNYINVFSPTTIIATDTAICIYNSASISITTGNGVNGTYYTWSPSYGLNTTTGNSLIANPTTTILYYVKGVCGEKDSVLVTIWPLPTISLIPSPSICVGGPTNLTALGTNYYSWSPSNYLNATTGAMVTTNSTAIITYTVKGIDNNGCISVPKSVIIYPIPQVSYTPNITIGCQPLPIVYTNQSQTVSPPSTCFWNFGDGSTSTNCNPPVHIYTNAGIYSVTLTVTDNKGCVNALSQSSLITVYPVPTANFTYAPQPTTIINAIMQYTDHSIANSSTFSTAITNWDWTFGDPNNSTSTQQHPTYIYNDTGNYVVQLIVTDGHNCQDTITHIIRIDADYVFYIPNSFTPNGDNNNDVFIAYSSIIGDFEMLVFDRWGNRIFESNDIKKGWDGKVQNKSAQEDVYVYVINTSDYKSEKHTYLGYVSLVR